MISNSLNIRALFPGCGFVLLGAFQISVEIDRRGLRRVALRIGYPRCKMIWTLELELKSHRYLSIAFKQLGTSLWLCSL